MTHTATPLVPTDAAGPNPAQVHYRSLYQGAALGLFLDPREASDSGLSFEEPGER